MLINERNCVNNVATIILTWNKCKDVCSVIEDTAKLNLNGVHLDIYVVDNASTDGTQAYLEQHYPHIKVLQTGENLGGSGGFSYGLQFVSQLEYDYIWLLDNDVRLDSNALIPLVETLQNYPEVGLVGSQIRKLDDPDIIQEIGAFIHPEKAHLKTFLGNSPVKSSEEILDGNPYITVDICAAASLLVRRQVVQKIGVFDNYFLHFDDVEWCLRAQKAGWIVAANPTSIVWHASPDFKFRPWVSYYDERNICYCWQKHYPKLLWKRLLVVLPKLIYYSATGRFFLSLIYLQGYQDFWNGIQGKMPEHQLYKEEGLKAIIEDTKNIIIQPSIYKNVQQLAQNSLVEKVILRQEINLSKVKNHSLQRIWGWFLGYFYKSFDLVIVSCDKPDIHMLNLGKRAYVFTGQGFIKYKTNFTSTFRYIFFTIFQIISYILKCSLYLFLKH
jgi:GT2 family glycosyltransferase